MIHDDDSPEKPATTEPAPSPYQDEVNEIRRRDDAAFIAIIAAKSGGLSATFSDAPFDLHLVAVALRTIADALEEQDKRAKAAADLVLKHDN